MKPKIFLSITALYVVGIVFSNVVWCHGTQKWKALAVEATDTGQKAVDGFEQCTTDAVEVLKTAEGWEVIAQESVAELQRAVSLAERCADYLYNMPLKEIGQLRERIGVQ